MAYSYNNKAALETFLVAATSGTVPNDGTALIDSANALVNLADGQIGIFNASPLNAASGAVAYMTAVNHTTTYDTVATAPWIQIYQGTNGSADLYSEPYNYPLWNRPYEASQVIKGQNNLLVTKQAPVAPTKSCWTIGNASNPISALDNTEYALSVAFRGRGVDEDYSPEATAHTNVSYLTPNYTALSTAEPVDHLIQNLVWNLNRNSRAIAYNRTRFRGNAPFVAFAVQYTSPSTGQPIGGGVNALVAGDVVPVVETNFGTRNYTVTAEDVAAIQAAAIAATGALNVGALDANIIKVDLSTAGTATGGVADMIIILALDRRLAFEDRIPQVKIRLDVGLKSGFDFNLVHHSEGSKASEGQGQGRALDLWYKATHGQRKYNLDHTEDPVVEFPSPIDTADAYYQYTILHEDVKQTDTGSVVVNPLKEVLLIPDANTTLVTAIDNILGAWVTSANGVGIIEA